VTRVAVVGHVEWVEFLRVSSFPARGSVTAAAGASIRAGGGAVVAAMALRDLGAEVVFFCALGRDDNGRAAEAELTSRGIDAHVAWRDSPTRRVVTLLETQGERTIITVGERLQPEGTDELPWDRLKGVDGVYFTAGDAGAAQRARAAPALVSTPRARDALRAVDCDALIFSAGDDDERSWADQLKGHSRLLVATEGAHGGHWCGVGEGRWAAAPLPGQPQDDYGCGDSFAAGFTYGLARGLAVLEAAKIGAERGAWALTQAGVPG
jgi:ribokinase